MTVWSLSLPESRQRWHLILHKRWPNSCAKSPKNTQKLVSAIRALKLVQNDYNYYQNKLKRAPYLDMAEFSIGRRQADSYLVVQEYRHDGFLPQTTKAKLNESSGIYWGFPNKIT